MTATPHPNRQTCQPTTASTGRKTRTLSGKPASPQPAAKMNEQAQRLYGRNDHAATHRTAPEREQANGLKPASSKS